MIRTTPNSVKENPPKPILNVQDYKKQASQPAVMPEHNNFFHIPTKSYSRTKLTLKPQVTTSKSIEEKRYKVKMSDGNNRTNSSSKSRISAFATLQVDEDSILGSQNALKLKKIIGDSGLFNTQILKQLSKQNLTSDSQSPGLRGQNKSAYKKSAELDHSQILKEKTLLHKKTQSLSVNKQKELIDQLWSLDKQIQQSLNEQLKKQYYLKSRGMWDNFKESFIKSFGKSSQNHKNSFNSLTGQVKEIEQQWTEIIVSIVNNLFELQSNSAVLMSCDYDQKYTEMIEQMRRERDIWQSNYKQIEQERDVLLETVQQLKQSVEIKSQQYPEKNKDIDQMDTIQLKEISSMMQQKIQEMSDKESKLIKLVLAIRKTGVDIEKIYNEEVLNDDSLQSEQIIESRKVSQIEKSFNDADNSVVNDSDESSFCYRGRQDNDSVIESIRRFENRNINNLPDSKSQVKLKLDLTKCKQQLTKIKIPEQQDNIGFHQEFMMKFNEFSESWRIQAMKDERQIYQFSYFYLSLKRGIKLEQLFSFIIEIYNPRIIICFIK
ncbi:hypothetical protein pb186bvf_011863 [Paramecium bursaria]